MAINRVDFPTTPNPVSGDWAKIVNLVSKSFQNINDPLQVDGSNIPQGATFQVGGVVYYADSDTAISGTTSDYVKLTVSGSTLVPSFTSSLSGVTWNKIYNGYYDTSNNLYIFDEVKAILAGALSGIYSKFSELWNNNFDQRLKTTDDVTFNTVNTGYGNNNVYDKPVFNNYTTVTSDIVLPDGGVGQLNFMAVDNFSNGNIDIYLPAGGTWGYAYIAEYTSYTQNNVNGGTVAVTEGANDLITVIYMRLT